MKLVGLSLLAAPVAGLALAAAAQDNHYPWKFGGFKKIDAIHAGLEMDKLMDPAKYKAAVQELKKTYDVAGRKAAKYETGHGIVRFRTKGYALIDLEWGLGLEGYLTTVQNPDEAAIDLAAPVCLYKVLRLETKAADPNVFIK